jgi:hypothetical protein
MSELADYYRLRDKDLLSGSVAIVEGHTLVRRLLGMGLVPRSLLCVRGQEDILCTAASLRLSDLFHGS